MTCVGSQRYSKKKLLYMRHVFTQKSLINTAYLIEHISLDYKLNKDKRRTLSQTQIFFLVVTCFESNQFTIRPYEIKQQV